MADSSTLTAIVCSLQDSVMLLAPRGWTTLELRFAHTAHGPRLEELETKGQGSTQPKARPELHVEQRHEVQRINEGVAELTALLAQAGKRWAPGSIRVERPKPDFVDWKLVGDEGQVIWFTRLGKDELDELIVTDELFDVLLGTEQAFGVLQGQVEAALGPVTGFAYDARAGVLKLERPAGAVELHADVVGQYHPKDFTWVWGWSDEATPRAVVERFARLCAPDVQQEGLSAFWRPGLHCDEGFAWAVAGSAVVSTGARGLFRAEVKGHDAAIFFALRELPTAPA
ncbi:MAG: hypothetical protein IT380_08590 [Myxococcales bacterium]|nr:hypothetical protein [Myxococcales bacterium]